MKVMAKILQLILIADEQADQVLKSIENMTDKDKKALIASIKKARKEKKKRLKKELGSAYVSETESEIDLDDPEKLKSN